MSSRPDNVTTIFGGMGRHKPDSIKDTQGTLRPDRAKAEADYDKLPSDMIPAVPEWMVDPVARAIFVESFQIMNKAGVLTVADVGILEVYAVERAMIQRRYQQAYSVIPGPDGEPEYIINAGMIPGTEKLNAFRMLSSELGFTPVSRHKVVKQRDPKDKNKDGWGGL